MLQSEKGMFAYFDLVVVVLAVLANCTVLVALARGKFGHQLSYRTFLLSLASCDLFTCVVNLSTVLYQVYMTNFANQDTPTYYKCGANVLRTLQLAGFFINLLNLCAMSFDHFCLVVYTVRYRQTATQNLARVSVIVIWIASFVLVSIDGLINIYLYENMKLKQTPPITSATTEANWLGSSTGFHLDGWIFRTGHEILGEPGITDPTSKTKAQEEAERVLSKIIDDLRHESKMVQFEKHKKSGGFCTFFTVKKFWFDMCIFILVFVCLGFLIFCYGLIFKRISARMNAAEHRTKRLAITTCMFLGAFIICWLPFMIIEFSMFIIIQNNKNTAANTSDHDSGDSSPLTYVVFFQNLLNSLLWCYPLCDPIIYAFRVPAVQLFVAIVLTVQTFLYVAFLTSSFFLDNLSKIFPICSNKIRRKLSSGPITPNSETIGLKGTRNTSS